MCKVLAQPPPHPAAPQRAPPKVLCRGWQAAHPSQCLCWDVLGAESPSSPTLQCSWDTAAPIRAVTVLQGGTGTKDPLGSSPGGRHWVPGRVSPIPLGPSACAGDWDLPVHWQLPLTQGKVGCPRQVRTSENQSVNSPTSVPREGHLVHCHPGTSLPGTCRAQDCRISGVGWMCRVLLSPGSLKGPAALEQELLGGGVGRYLQFPPTPGGFSLPAQRAAGESSFQELL